MKKKLTVERKRGGGGGTVTVEWLEVDSESALSNSCLGEVGSNRKKKKKKKKNTSMTTAIAKAFIR